MSTHHTLAQRISHNVRRLRGDHSQATLADASRLFGTSWQSGHISHFEKADYKATHEAVTLLQLSLTTLLERPVALGELLGYDPEYRPDRETGEVDPDYWGANQPFDLGGGFEVLPSDYLQYLRDDDPQHLITAARSLRTLRERFISTPQEEKLARKLGVSPERFRELSQALWGTTFEQRRDQLAGDGASPQRKGRYSVQLLAELREAMGGDLRG